MDDNEAKRQRIANYCKWGLGLAGAALIAPVALLAVKGIVGIILALGLGYGAIELAPAFSFKLANWRMKMIMAEASKNPIETMRNTYLEKSQVIREKDQKIVEFGARLADYHDQMIDFERKFPADAGRYKSYEDQLKHALQSMKAKQQAAKQSQAEYKSQIERAESIYKMACAAHAVSELIGNAAQETYIEIKEQVAFDSVNHQFNTAVAALSLEVDNQKLPPSSVTEEIVDTKVRQLQ